MKSVGEVLCWLLALILLLAVALYSQSQAMALFALAGMVLVLPPTGRSLAKKTGFEGRLKQVSVGLALGFVIGPVVSAMIGGFTAKKTDDVAAEVTQTDERMAEAQAAMKAREAKWAEEQAAAAAKRLAERKAEHTRYTKRLDDEISSISMVGVSTYTGSVEAINVGLVTIGAWALFYEEGGRLGLDAETQEKRQEFKNLLAKKQAQILPAMRDAYGPAMRQQLWEADGSAKTFGAGFRTIEFVSAAFARNANIKKINDQMTGTLMMLRFARAQYKWFDGATEYTYYTLSPPKDPDVVKWNPNGSFQILD